MRWGLSWLLSLTMLVSSPPMLTGRATWYGKPYIGREMRNDEIYTGQDATCAVDDAMWAVTKSQQLTVCTDTSCVICTVTDTGYLAEYGVVIDLSPAVFRVLAPLDVGVQDVRVWPLR